MSQNDAEDRIQRMEAAVKQGAPVVKSSAGIDADCKPVISSPPPREIVVYCEGFGAGRGGGWFIEVSFVEWNHGGFSVFLRTDEDDDYEDSIDDCSEEDSLDENAEDVPMRARRIATVKEPLTWRGVLKFARRRRCMRVSDDSADIQICGVEPWHRDVIASAMMRDRRI